MDGFDSSEGMASPLFRRFLSICWCNLPRRRRTPRRPPLGSSSFLLLISLALISGLISTVSSNSNLGTLKTFQAYACDDELLNIKCPHRTTISVQFAQYGRQVPSYQLCAPKTTPLSHFPESDNASCLATGSLQYELFQVVVSQCQEKRQCKVQTSPASFGTDPCPGIRKYVEVTYKCRPNEFVTKVICEGEQLHLKCQKASRIAIYSASFGRSRHSSVECPQPDGVPDEECQASYSTEAVMRMCHGKRKCTMMADIQTFGNPCDEKTRRYLKVVYTCVPTRILKSMYQSVATGEDYDGEGEIENDGDEELVEEPGYKAPPTGLEDGETVLEGMKPAKESKKKEMANQYPSSMSATQFPSAPLTTAKDVQGDDSEEENVGMGTGTDEDSQINCTVAGYPGSGDHASVGVIKEWITAFNFLRGNTEKLILYLSVSIAAGLVILMLVVIIRLMIQKRQERKRAKLNISEPLPNGFGDDMSDIDQDITDLSQSSPRQDPSVAVVRYTNRSTMRRQDSDTNPRAPITTRAHNNFYYS